MFLDYLALVILLMGLTMVFFAFIFIHDLPHTIAKKRHHPHEEAIHVGCWLSLFTLHALWPFIYLWAVSHKPGAEGTHAAGVPGIAGVPNIPGTSATPGAPSTDSAARLAELEARLQKLENAK